MVLMRAWDVGLWQYLVTLEIRAIPPVGEEYSAEVTQTEVERAGARSVVKGVPSFHSCGPTANDAADAAMARFDNWLREQKILDRR